MFALTGRRSLVPMAAMCRMLMFSIFLFDVSYPSAATDPRLLRGKTSTQRSKQLRHQEHSRVLEAENAPFKAYTSSKGYYKRTYTSKGNKFSKGSKNMKLNSIVSFDPATASSFDDVPLVAPSGSPSVVFVGEMSEIETSMHPTQAPTSFPSERWVVSYAPTKSTGVTSALPDQHVTARPTTENVEGTPMVATQSPTASPSGGKTSSNAPSGSVGLISVGSPLYMTQPPTISHTKNVFLSDSPTSFASKATASETSVSPTHQPQSPVTLSSPPTTERITPAGEGLSDPTQVPNLSPAKDPTPPPMSTTSPLATRIPSSVNPTESEMSSKAPYSEVHLTDSSLLATSLGPIQSPTTASSRESESSSKVPSAGASNTVSPTMLNSDNN